MRPPNCSIRRSAARTCAVRRVFVPPMHVVARQSTDTMTTNDPIVIAALRYIRAHAAEGVNVANIVHDIGVGRRKLERKFRTILGRSVLQEIRRTRITQAQKLLAGTDLPMPTVAKLSGFSSAHRLDDRFSPPLRTAAHGLSSAIADPRRMTRRS